MPRAEFSWKALDAMLQFKVTLEYCADYLKVSRDTIMRRIREEHDMSFTEYAAIKRQRTAMRLQQKAIEMALGGEEKNPNPTMMIFALKNLAGWADKMESTVEGSGMVINMAYDPDKRTT